MENIIQLTRTSDERVADHYLTMFKNRLNRGGSGPFNAIIFEHISQVYTVQSMYSRFIMFCYDTVILFGKNIDDETDEETLIGYKGIPNSCLDSMGLSDGFNILDKPLTFDNIAKHVSPNGKILVIGNSWIHEYDVKHGVAYDVNLRFALSELFFKFIRKVFK